MPNPLKSMGSTLGIIALVLLVTQVGIVSALFGTGVLSKQKIIRMAEAFKTQPSEQAEIDETEGADATETEGTEEVSGTVKIADKPLKEHLQSIELVQAFESLREKERLQMDRQDRAKTQRDQMQTFLKDIQQQIDTRINEYERVKLEKTETNEERASLANRSLGKAELKKGLAIFETMKPAAAMTMLIEESDEIAVQYLQYMDTRRAGKIIDQMANSADPKVQKKAGTWIKMLRENTVAMTP